jgi:succinyl-CoA synthetase beta subunit
MFTYIADAAEYVVKAQIHAGGRGMGVFDNGFKGGVHLCKTPPEVQKLAKQMLGNKLKTKQTPPEGVMVNKVCRETCHPSKQGYN